MGSRFAEQIREHMEVIGADGQHVGTVDHIDGEQIKLTKSDSDMASGSAQHRYLPLSQVASVEGDKVRLSGSGAGGSGMDQDR